MTIISDRGLTLDDLPAIVEGLRQRLVEKGSRYGFALISVTRDGWRVYFSPDGEPSRHFEAATLRQALAAAEEWLDRDELAETYATIGLTADGRLPAEARQ